MKLSHSVILLTLMTTLAACAHHPKPNPKPQPHPQPTPADPRHWPVPVQGRLEDSDITEIIALIQRTPNIQHQIAWIEVQSPRSLVVYTGKVAAPLAGGGNVVTLQRRHRQWVIIGDPSSSFWNA